MKHGAKSRSAGGGGEALAAPAQLDIDAAWCLHFFKISDAASRSLTVATKRRR